MVSAPPSRKVFIVHGKDEKNKDALKAMLQNWALEPIILAEQSNRGRTLIEKLLDHTSDVGFAFVLMTADDVGANMSDYEKLRDRLGAFRDTWYSENGLGWPRKIKKHLVPGSDIEAAIKQSQTIFKPRARQNVVFEYGLCVGTLKRGKVCLLVSGEVELPTDILGYAYIKFDSSIRECELDIRRELEAAGYFPSLQKAGFILASRIDYCDKCGNKETVYPRQDGRFLCLKCLAKE
jgi:predicted nucleotide-binding protein